MTDLQIDGYSLKIEDVVSILIESIENKTTAARRIEIDGPLMVRGSARMSEK